MRCKLLARAHSWKWKLKAIRALCGEIETEQNAAELTSVWAFKPNPGMGWTISPLCWCFLFIFCREKIFLIDPRKFSMSRTGNITYDSVSFFFDRNFFITATSYSRDVRHINWRHHCSFCFNHYRKPIVFLPSLFRLFGVLFAKSRRSYFYPGHRLEIRCASAWTVRDERSTRRKSCANRFWRKIRIRNYLIEWNATPIRLRADSCRVRVTATAQRPPSAFARSLARTCCCSWPR